MSYSQRESLVLLSRIRAGDQQAIDLLFRRYTDRLLGLIRSKLGGDLRRKVESMDVLQESLALALKRIEVFVPHSEGALLRWFSTIIDNRIQNIRHHFRSKKRNFFAEVPLEIGAGQDDPPLAREIPGLDRTPSHLLALQEELGRITRALDALSPEQKELVILRKFQGLAFEDIGRLKGKSPDAVRMAFARTMVKLAAVLEDK